MERRDAGPSLGDMLPGSMANRMLGGLNWRTCLIGVVLLACAVCVLPLLLGGNLFGGDDEEDVDGNNTDGVGDVLDEPGEQEIEVAGGEVELNRVVTADDLDRDGCAENSTDTFEPSEDIYVVAEADQIPEGTDMYVRLYHDGEPIEDAPTITADQDYEDICVNFVFERDDTTFEPGAYEAEFIINGNPAEAVEFEVR